MGSKFNASTWRQDWGLDNFPSEEAAGPYKRRIRDQLPPDGQVRLLAVTERQFGKQEVYYGRKRVRPEKEPAELMLF